MDERERLTIDAHAIAPGDMSQHAFRITPTGEIDIESAPKLESVFDELIEAGASMVVLDATSIEFIDSTGLRAIVAAGNRLDAIGGRLLIEGMSGAVQRVLEVTGLIDRYRD
jgi:anti-sigma B factor antagonist